MTAPEDAELNDAELNGAELNGAELNGAELNGAEPVHILPEDDAAPPPSSVDATLRQRLDEIATQPLGAQAEAYQQIHTELQQSLADIDAS